MRNERGFTLAELLVAIAVIGLLMGALFVTLQQGQSAFLFGSSRAEVQQNARAALAKMVEELRTGSTVTALSATSITFQFVDFDPINPTVGLPTTVQYSRVGNDLQRNQTAPVPAAETLVGGVTNLSFTGFNQDDRCFPASPASVVPPICPAAAAIPPDPPNVYSVHVRITTQPERPVAGYSPANQQAVFEDRVKLRNK
ncbi:MAG: PilW family protein [Candidatus Rokuibacteriota bacterium]